MSALAASPAARPSPPSRPAGPPPAPTPAVGYFDGRWPAAAILAAFPLVSLPLAAAVALDGRSLLVWLYVWLFGTTHFVVTFAVYLQSGNLRHFAGSWRNRVTFFLVPAALFVGFDLYHAFRVGAALPAAGLLLLVVVRLLDFNHLNRQLFGVLQMFKARGRGRFPAWMKRVEGGHFLLLTLLLFVSFLSGGVCPLAVAGGPLSAGAAPASAAALLPVGVAQVAWCGLVLAVAATATALLAGVARAAGGRRGAAAAYLLVQTACALLPAVSLPLYLAALAVHYVEYHVLMAPRCLRTPLDPAYRIDRAFGRLRRSPARFYAAVLVAAGVITLATYAGMGMMGADPGSAADPVRYLALIAVFDGIFVFHYFVEAFIWKFSDPHFRASMSGLYFAPAAAR